MDTGRDGNIMENMVGWMRRDRMVVVKLLDWTGRYTTIVFAFFYLVKLKINRELPSKKCFEMFA